MQKISRQALEALLEAGQPQPAVTLYAPMHTTASPPHLSENQIRFKNLIRQAADELPDNPDGRTLRAELEEFLAGAQDDIHFWENQTPGLLLCARPGKLELFHLPVDTDEYVSVDETFHLGPVLAMATEDNRPFYVLSVNQQGPELFRGDMYGLYQSGLSLPANLRAALNIDEVPQESEHQGSAVGRSMKTGWFNGRGGARNPEGEERQKFFRMIDELVLKFANPPLPLILAGTEDELVEYRAHSKYPALLKGTINGSFGGTRPEALFAPALDIIRSELIDPSRAAAVEEYERLEGANPERTARDLKSIEQATDQGRVDKLLASMYRHTTDTIRDTKQTITKITFPDLELSKSLNRLAAKVWRMSGSVINLTPHEMPHGAPVVARLRY